MEATRSNRFLKASEWLTEPAWLHESDESWPKAYTQLFQQKTDGLEQVFAVVSEEINKEWKKIGSFTKSNRIFAYCFCFKWKSKDIVLAVEEVEGVSRVLLRKSQMDSFYLVFQALASGKRLAVFEYLNKLSSSLDDQNIMRLREQLRHAAAS